MTTHLRIGCRSSRLAMMQTEQAGIFICARTPGTTFELVNFETSGDRIAGSLKRAGGKGHFVRDVEQALADGHINLAIHCLKDMPGNEREHPDLMIAGYLPREDPEDVFVSARYASIGDLPTNARVGTSSPRRAAQLRALRPDLVIDEEFRGSIDTRLRKVAEGVVDATLLALAGLKRVGNYEYASKRLDVDAFLPAVGQGTLALQCATADSRMVDVCVAASDPDATFAALVERMCLRQLNGDCHSPIAGLCRRVGLEWHFAAAVYDATGRAAVRAALTRDGEETAESFGHRMAETLMAKGATRFLPARSGMVDAHAARQ